MVGHDSLWKYMHSDARSLAETFRRGARISDNGPCLGYRKLMPDGSLPYVWLSYEDVLERSENLARGFIEKGLAPGQKTFIGIYSLNRPEWVITEQACYFFSMVTIPLYDTLGPEACSYIINQAEIRVVIVDRPHKAELLVEKRHTCPSLQCIVLIEPPSDALLQKATNSGVEVTTFDEVQRMGFAARKRLPPFSPLFPTYDDLATICYTSGTTGNPKGVMMTHGNIVSGCTGCYLVRFAKQTTDDVMISFLPMAHMYEKLMQSIVYMAGGAVGFSQCDVKTLADDIKTLRPTIIPTVPRLLNRVYDRIMAEASKSKFKKWLLNLAVERKTKDINNLILRRDTIFDKYVFRKLHENMGGRVRLMISGSAPISHEVLHFMRAAMSCVILEGYGATETAASGSLSLEGDNTENHVGPPTPCNEIKLIDVIEMNYFAKNNQGEVCLRGYNVFQGYYKDPEKTAEALDKDGWFHTGDIGMWTKQGTLRLIDRKKHIFKLDQGEYIAPEKIENIYNRTQYVAQCYVHGDSMRSYLVGIVVPDPEVLPAAAQKELNLKLPFDELVKNPRVKKMIHDDMLLEGNRSGLGSFEQVKQIELDAKPFSVENGLLTPTLKSKRASLHEYYKNEINEMYEHR